MDALRASYGDSSSCWDSDADSYSDSPPPPPQSSSVSNAQLNQTPLPPPPLALLDPRNSMGISGHSQNGNPSRVRSFPHIEGNYALHVYIPVYIPPAPRKELVQFLKKITALVPGLHVVDIDVPLNNLLKDDHKFEQVALGKQFHISLGRTVPIRLHQRDTIVTMLRQKLQSQRRYWIDFNKWEVFVNDDHSRTFLSMEVKTGGLAEIIKQIQAVNEVYKLHNLPEFYKDPRPHISVAWSLGDISELMKRVVDEEMKKYNTLEGSSRRCIFTCNFGGVSCRIGNKTYKICKAQEE